jgi:hypothetical protein
MARGTYIHSSKSGWTFDGVREGSSTKSFACDTRELGQRALNAMNAENEGDRLDRFFVVKRRTKGGRR